jgi:hypothetical protein
MKYALGNMLNGAGGLNADGLSLDLQFAADKTLTARKGPTPTFTRASTATFVGSDGLIQSAAVDAARFDHDPVTLACKGLLIEEARTNLVFPSDTLTTQTRTVTAVAHTLSFYGTGTVVLSGVAIATVIGTGAYPTRTTLTFTPTAGSLILTVTGSVTEAQLEAGAFPTSYIPTVASSVVRSADVCDVIGADVHPSVGTLVVNFDRRTLNGVTFRSPGRVLASASATGADYVGIDHNDTTVRAPIRAANATVSTLSHTDASVGNTKVAVAWASGDSAHVSGGIVRASTSAAIAFANPLDTISFCGIPPNPVSTTISSIRYYKKRLPNAKLQALTV